MNAPEARTLALDEIAAFGRLAEELADIHGPAAGDSLTVHRPRFQFRATRERIDFIYPERAKRVTLVIPGWDPAASPVLPRPILGIKYCTSPDGHKPPADAEPPGVEVLRQATAEEIDQVVELVNETAQGRTDLEIVDGDRADPFIELDLQSPAGLTALIDAPHWNRQRGRPKQLHRPWVRGVWWLLDVREFLRETYALELDD